MFASQNFSADEVLAVMRTFKLIIIIIIIIIMIIIIVRLWALKTISMT